MIVPPFYPRRWRWAALGLAFALPACGAILGIDPGIPEEAGVDGGKGVPDATFNADAPGSTPDAKHPSDAVIPHLDASVDVGVPTLHDGGPALFYVTPDGSLTGSCGAITEPCGTVRLGIQAAGPATQDGGGAVVLVAEGNYAEVVNLVSGVSLQGGFTANFQRTVAPGPDSGTIVSGDGEKVVVGSNLQRSLSLSNLTFVSAATLNPGDSVYGMFLTNDAGLDGSVLLQNVIVIVGAGAAGSPGTVGGSGTAGTGTMGCAVGSGATGAAGDPAPAGTFSIAGFSTTPGGTGGAGDVGAQGAAGNQKCLTGGTACEANCLQIDQVCSGGGEGGCGGGPGGGGSPGGGGGASVALFAWNVPVTVAGGVLSAGAGGNGGAGGAGGRGGPGAVGTTPSPVTVVTACLPNGVGGCYLLTSSSVAGDPGGTGEEGGAGGTGAAGAGGSSFAIYWYGASPTQANPKPVLLHGDAGTGSAPGHAGAIGSAP